MMVHVKHQLGRDSCSRRPGTHLLITLLVLVQLSQHSHTEAAADQQDIDSEAADVYQRIHVATTQQLEIDSNRCPGWLEDYIKVSEKQSESTTQTGAYSQAASSSLLGLPPTKQDQTTNFHQPVSSRYIAKAVWKSA